MTGGTREARLAWLFVLPATSVMVLVILAPLLWTFWESLHLHDLRLPWLGRPFGGAANYVEALGDPRFRAAMVRTFGFAAITVAIEVTLGLVLALAMHRVTRGRAAVRVAVLLPWAIPTVVAALLWRFMFESEAGLASAALAWIGLAEPGFVWFIHTKAAWVPIILADVWKMTPFVALLLLAGLNSIDVALYEAAQIDGAGPWRQFTEITLPLVMPALAVAVLFRTLDAFRVFDLIYVLTGGGPGTSTEPVSLYTFSVLLQHLRFGYGSALSIIVFVVSFVFALLYIRVVARSLTGGAR